MIKTVFKLHYILWAVAILAIVIGFNTREQTIDFNIHDTYYVIAKIQVYSSITLYFGFVGLVYWLFYHFRKKTFRLLDILYVVFMFLGISGLIVIPLFGMKDVYYTNTAGPSNKSAIIMIILAQLVLIINFIVTLLKRRRFE